MEIDLTKTNEEIREAIALDFMKGNPIVTKEIAMKFAIRTTQFLECKESKNRENPMKCMFCSFGHMTECHFPLTCEEANCSHYQSESMEFDEDEDEND